MVKTVSRGSTCTIIPLALLAFLSGCTQWSQRGAKGIGTLPPAARNETKFSTYQPAHPYVQLTRGLLGRQVFVSRQPAEVAVEINDFLVGPNQRSGSYTLQATAIFEVQAGNGVLAIGEKSQKIEPGTVLSVAAGQPFTIENQSSIPIAIRVEILGVSKP